MRVLRYQYNSGDRDLAVAGRKLQVLLPRMILRTVSMRSSQKAAVEMWRLCTRYLDGDWQALIAECPAPIGVAQRACLERREVEKHAKPACHSDAPAAR